MPWFLNAVTGLVLYASLALAIGAVVSRWLILPRSIGHRLNEVASLAQATARIGCVSALCLFVGLGLYLLRQLVEFHDPFAPWADDATLLIFKLDWGRTWRLAVLAAFVALIGFFLASRGRRIGWWLATASVLALGLFPGLTGHANAGDLRPFTLVADLLHVWAMGGWVGGLALVLLLERGYRLGRLTPPSPGPESGEPVLDQSGQSLLPLLVPRFSRIAVPCVATVVVSGMFAAWIHVESISALLTTRYGRLLLIKVGVVLGVLILGAINWRRLKPRLQASTPPTAMRRVAMMEVAMMILVVIVTALLVRTDPAQM